MRLLPFLLFITGYLTAQTDTVPDYKRLQFGGGFGQFEQNVDFSTGGDAGAVRGSTVAVALRYFDRQLIGFQAELSYTGAGWQEEFDSLSVAYERKTNYAELLILTQLSPGRGVIQPMLQAGPYLSVPLSESETVPSGFDPATVAANTYYGRKLNFRLNYGLQAGAGLNVELGPLTIQVSGRYILGFSDLIKPGETQVTTSRRQGYGGMVNLFYAW